MLIIDEVRGGRDTFQRFGSNGVVAVGKVNQEMSPGGMEVLLVLRRGNKRVKRAKMLQAYINPGQPTTNTSCIA